MTHKELTQLIAIGEGLHLEFKSSHSHLGREICAFANSSGGRILLGVDDGGRLVGVSNHNRVKSEIQAIARTMDPPLGLLIESVVRQGVIPSLEGINEGLDEGSRSLYVAIISNPGIQAKALSSKLNGRPIKTLERQLRKLKELGLVEHRGSRKTGGYWSIRKE